MAKIDHMLRARQLLAHDAPYCTLTRCGGVDEAGRGPLAGAVFAACVIMPADPVLPWVDDSKKLSEARREEVFEQILQTALFVGVGRAEPAEIDALNILQATKLAMRRACAGVVCDGVLIDAVTGLGLCAKEIPIIHGDALSYCIAAASIVAKVSRDREMRRWHELYPQYGFVRHKGYGTPEHVEALRIAGPCPLHRQSFLGGILI